MFESQRQYVPPKFSLLFNWYTVAQLIEAFVLQAVRSRVRFPMGSFGFFIYLILPASNGNEYQEYFLRGKGG